MHLQYVREKKPEDANKLEWGNLYQKDRYRDGIEFL